MTQNEYVELSLEELENKLSELKADYEDNEELREMQLGQEGHHISSGIAEKYDIILADLQKKIDEIKKIIEEKS